MIAKPAACGLAADELQGYLQQQIPLCRALGTRVIVSSPEQVVLRAPFEPNINHRCTVFGGSLSALAIVAAWALVYVRLRAEGLERRIVIHRNSMDYLKPVTGEFTATCAAPEPDVWDRFLKHLQRKGKSRVPLQTIVTSHGETVARLEGEFVAMDD